MVGMDDQNPRRWWWRWWAVMSCHAYLCCTPANRDYYSLEERDEQSDGTSDATEVEEIEILVFNPNTYNYLTYV